MSRLAFLVPLILSVVILTACRSSGEQVIRSTPSPPNVTTLNSLPPDLRAALEELEEIQTARADVTFNGSGSRQVVGIMEFQAPDRFYLRAQGSETAQQTEAIAINEEYYIKIASDWFRSSFSPPPTPAPGTYEDLPFLYSSGGVTKVDGKECNLYTFSAAPEKGQLPPLATSELCIADNRVLRLVLRDATRTLAAVFHYDLPVSIERPALN